MLIAGTEFKSAELITDPEVVFQRLNEAVEKEKSRLGTYAAHTSVRKSEDGRSIVGKRGGCVIAGARADAKLLDKQMDFSAVAGQASELQRIATERGIQWESALASRAVPYWASDQRPDAHGDIVLQNWLFDEFEDNHPLANSHDWGGFPIGSVIAWQVVQRSSAKYMGPALQLLSLFATKEQFSEADTAHRLVRAGFMVGGSVGFSADKVIDIKDEDERQKLGLGRWGFVLDDNHLLEFSPTLLGANSGAFAILSRAKSKGLLAPKDLAVVRELERESIVESGDRDRWGDVDSKYVQMARMLFPDSEWKRHGDVDTPMYERTVEEVDPLNGYVPGTTSKAEAKPDAKAEGDDTQALADAVADLTVMVEEGLLGISSAISDIRDMMEQMTSNSKAADEEDPDDEEDDEEDEDDDTDGKSPAGKATAIDSDSESDYAGLLRRLEELNTDFKTLRERKVS